MYETWAGDLFGEFVARETLIFPPRDHPTGSSAL